jgi:hypothetical protein
MKIYKFRFAPFLVLAILLLATPFLMAFDAMQSAEPVHPFFDGFTAEELFTLFIFAVVGFSQGLWPKFSIFEWLKTKLGLEDQGANLLIYMLSMIVGGLALWIAGTFTTWAVSFDLEMLLSMGGVMYAFSQKGYQMLKAGKLPDISDIIDLPVWSEEETTEA